MRTTPIVPPARSLPLAAAVLLTAGLANPAPARAQLGGLFARGADALRRQADQAQSSTLTQTVTVRDVDLATLKTRLARFGVEVPLEAEGNVTATFTVAAQLGRITQPGAVSATGTLSSPRLALAPAEGGDAANPVVLEDVEADLRLASGLLTLTDLSVTLPPPKGSPKAPSGTVTGTATLPLAGSETDVTAAVTAQNVALALLWERLGPASGEPGGGGLPLAGGVFSGNVKVAVPWARRADPAAYRATATLTVTDLTAAGRSVDDLTANLALKEGTATLTKLTATVAGQPLTGAAEVGLAAPFPARASLTSERFDLGTLPALFPPAEYPDGPPAWLPADLSGALALTLAAKGTLEPRAGALTGRVRGENLGVNGVAVAELAADLSAKLDAGAEAVRLNNLVLRTDRGTVRGSASADAAADRWAADLDATDLSPRLAEALPEAFRPPAGTVGGDGTVTVKGAASGRLAPFAVTAADVALTGSGLTALEVPVTDLAANLRVGGEAATLSDVRVVTDRGTFTGAATLALNPDGTPAGWTAEGRLNEVTTAAFDLIPPCFQPPPWLVGRTGRIAAAGRARGTLSPFSLGLAKAEVTAAGLELLSLPVETATAAVSYADGKVSVADLALNAAGGTLGGDLTLDFGADDWATAGDLTLSGIDLARLPPGLLPADYAATGTVAGNVTVDLRFPPPADPTAPRPDEPAGNDPCAPRRGFRVAGADGRLEADAPALTLPGGKAVALGSAAAAFGVGGDTLRLRDLTLTAPDEAGPDGTPRPGRGTLTGEGTVGLSAPHPFRAKLRWDGWPTAALTAPLLTAAGFPPGPAETDAGANGAAGPRDGRALGFLSAAGTLAPPDVATAEGLFRAENLRLPGLIGEGGTGGVSLPEVAAEFALDAERLRLKSLSATFAAPAAGGEPGETRTGTLTASGGVAVAAPFAWDLNLKAEAVPVALAGPLAAAAAKLDALPGPLSADDPPVGPGDFAGTIDAAAELSGSENPDDLKGKASATGTNLRVFGFDVEDWSAEIDTADGSVSLRRFTLATGGLALSGRARVNTAGDRRWSAAVNVVGFDPAELTGRFAPLLPAGVRLPVRAAGPLSAELTAGGSLTTGALTANAALAADRLTVAADEPAFGPAPLTDVTARAAYEAPAGGPPRATLERFAATLAGGQLRLTASLPLPGDEPSVRPTKLVAANRSPGPNGSATLIWAGGDVGDLLTAAFPTRYGAKGEPVPVRGTATVRAAAAWPAGRFAADTLSARVQATGEAFTLARRPGAARGAAFRKVVAAAELAGGRGKASVEARGFGGRFGAVAALRPVPASPGFDRNRPADPWPARVIAAAGWEGAALAKLEPLLRGRSGGPRLSLTGTADACLRFDSHPAGDPVSLAALLPGVTPPPGCSALPTVPPAEARDPRGPNRPPPPPRLTGSVRLAQVAFAGRPLLTQATLSVAARDAGSWAGEVRNGRYGGGTFTLRAVPAGGPAGGGGAVRVDLTLRDAVAEQALAPVPWVRENVRGRVALRATGVVGPNGVRLTGQGTLDGGRFLAAAAPGRPGDDYFFEVDRWRLPAELTFDPASGAGRVRFTGTTAGVGGGTVGGSATVDFGRGRGVGLDVNAELSGVDSDALLAGVGGAGAAGGLAGGRRVGGTVTLSGRAVTGLDDLVGEARLTLANAATNGLPILRAVTPYLRGGGVARGRKAGELVARLRDAVLRVERLTLTGSELRLFASGTAALPAGKLDLEVIADTGRRDAAEGALLRLAEEAAGPTPVGLVLRANRLLRDRVIYLEVGGTVRDPRVRVQTGRQLREEAIRFILGELFVPAGAGPAAAAAGGVRGAAPTGRLTRASPALPPAGAGSRPGPPDPGRDPPPTPLSGA